MKPQALLLARPVLEEWLIARLAKVRRKLGLSYSHVQTPDLLSFCTVWGFQSRKHFGAQCKAKAWRLKGKVKVFCLGLYFSNAKVRNFISSYYMNLIYLHCSLKVYKTTACLFSISLPYKKARILSQSLQTFQQATDRFISWKISWLHWPALID